MRRGSGTAVGAAMAGCSNVRDTKKRARHGLWNNIAVEVEGRLMNSWSFDSLTRTRHGLWKGVAT